MPPFENQNNIIASKERVDAMAGLRDVLQADAQFRSGEIGLGENLSRATSGLSRVVSGAIGNLLHSGGPDSGCDYGGGGLPDLQIAEKQQVLSQMDPGDDIRLAKKENAAYQDGQPDSGGMGGMYSDGGSIRQAKKEKESFIQGQAMDFGE